MAGKFEDRSARTVVVESNGPVRQLLAESIRAQGFKDVSSQASVADLLSYLETDDADWLVVPLQKGQEANGLHLLKILTQTPELKHIRVSLLLEDDERYVLPIAFELGLLSFHVKPFTKESLAEEFQHLMTVFEENGWQEPLTAASYLRRHLVEAGDFKGRLALEKSLLDLYPGDPNLLLHLAEPLAKSGKLGEAKAILSQVRFLKPEAEDKIKEMATQIFGDGEIGQVEGGLNVFGINNVVLVDSDETVLRALEEIFKEIGVPEVHSFTDGETAWEWLDSHDEPDLIIQEWRIPRLSGPYLVQRLRQKEFLTAPIVVLSSLLKPKDMPLVREMGVASIVNKPLKKDEFLSNLVWILREERNPSDSQALERKIRLLLQKRKLDEAEGLKAQFLANEGVAPARRKLIEAEFAFAHKQYERARDLAGEAVKLRADSILALNLLGKVFMCLTEYDAALKCFQKAQELSPQNVERLCAIAEVQTELGDHTAAADALNEAKDLDPDSQTVAEGEVKVALARGDTKSAKSFMGQLDTLSNVVSYMNNKAVAHAKCGHIDDAIDMYKKTMEAVPDDRQDIKAIVQYNLALSLIRQNDLKQAIAALDEVVTRKSKVQAKAKSLKERLEKALESGEEFTLRQSAGAIGTSDGEAKAASEEQQGSEIQDEDYKTLLAMVEARRGDICCYLIYNHPEGDERVSQLLANLPPFKPRDAIARQEAHGVEKTAKSA